MDTVTSTEASPQLLERARMIGDIFGRDAKILEPRVHPPVIYPFLDDSLMAYWIRARGRRISIIWTTGFTGYRILADSEGDSIEGEVHYFDDVITGEPDPILGFVSFVRTSCEGFNSSD